MQHKYIGQTAEDIAAFLKTAKGLSLTKLGEYLGSLCVLTLRTSCNICTGTGLTAATSAPGLRSPGHICTGTGRTPATSAPGLGSPLPDLHRDWVQPSHICTGTCSKEGSQRVLKAYVELFDFTDMAIDEALR